MVPRQTKIGGNGPIMAYAMAHLGIPVTYIGCLGLPDVHVVFSEFANKIKVYSIGEPGYSDAIEFNDGKLICGRQTSLCDITWQSILNRLPADELFQLVDQAGLIAFLNWGIILSMTDIIDEFLDQIGPRLKHSDTPFFIDTADPGKRPEQDILRFANTLPRLAEQFRVYLAFNLRESAFIARAVGIAPPDDTPGEVLRYAKQLRLRLGIESVIIHWARNAVASAADSEVLVSTLFTDNPRISTGAGDHFNAGFCLGRVLGGNLQDNMRLGIATSGYYVREANSPTLTQLTAFIEGLG